MIAAFSARLTLLLAFSLCVFACVNCYTKSCSAATVIQADKEEAKANSEPPKPNADGGQSNSQDESSQDDPVSSGLDKDSNNGVVASKKDGDGFRSSRLLHAALALFLAFYGAHAFFVVRKQSKLKTHDAQFRYYVSQENSDAIWTFLLVTCLLPLGITVISVAADSLTPSNFDGARSKALLNSAFLFWGLSKSVFV